MDDSIKIIENGYVFTGDGQNHAGRLSLLIKNDRIADIGKPSQVLRSLYPSAEIVDANNKVVVPGFVDAHHTGESFIMRYLTSGQPMLRWSKNPVINNVFSYLENGATYEDFLNLYRLSYCAAVKSGITTLAEYGIDTPEHSFTATVEAMRQANMKGFIGLHNSDQIEKAKGLHETKLHFAFVVENEEKLTTYDFQSAIRIARELGWPIILHLGQTRRAHDLIKKNFNKSILQLCAEYKIFDSPVHLIHLACFEEEDFDIISGSGVPLVFSPSAILKKETDMPPFQELLKYKITLALGTDWGPVQPIENLRTYCSILKSLGLPMAKAYALLALHTINSARALKLDNEIGTIETGKKADIVFLDLSEFRINTILSDENPEKILDILLQELSSQNVSDVMINGEFYVRNSHLLTYSEDDLLKDARSIYKKLLNVDKKQSVSAVRSATVLPFNVQINKRQVILDNEKQKEESAVKEKEKISSLNNNEKSDRSTGLTSKLPKNVRKIFGDDDL